MKQALLPLSGYLLVLAKLLRKHFIEPHSFRADVVLSDVGCACIYVRYLCKMHGHHFQFGAVWDTLLKCK